MTLAEERGFAHAPLVSIIVPVYNVERYLADCLDSILAQTMGDFEAILVNDGSTDASYDIAMTYVRRDPRLRLVSRPNGGIGAARNTGIEIARGRYLAFADSDDVLHPEMLAELLACAEAGGHDLVACDFCELHEWGTTCSERLVRSERTTFSQREFWHFGFEQAPSPFVVAWNKLYRREMFEDVRFAEGVLFEDQEIVCRLIAPRDSFGIVRRPLYCYRIHGESASKSLHKARYLDACDGVLARDGYFVERGWEELRIPNAEQLMSFLCVAYGGMGTADQDMRDRYDEMRGSTECLVRELLARGGCGRNFVMRARLFLLGERAYLAAARLHKLVRSRI